MTPEAKREYLRTYVQTYLREEILQEQLTRRVDPFRLFLEIAAQHNGCELNYAKLSRAIGVDDKTVRTVFSILEETLVATVIPALHGSPRKAVRQRPKILRV